MEVDFKKDKTYKAKTTPEIINIPKMKFIMVDGQGAPETSSGNETEFQRAMQAIFGIIYTIKFWGKKFPAPAGYVKFSMAPIEGLWWSKNSTTLDLKDMSNWSWTVMLRVPDFVTEPFFNQVVDECIKSKKSDVYKNARLEEFTEGQCVQIMHVGPYSSEGPTIEKMHAYAIGLGYKLIGKHHELYFGDPRRTKPEKLKTILRQPLKK